MTSKINVYDRSTKPFIRRRPTTQTEALEGWSPVAVAWCIDRGLMWHTPLQLTPSGWRWIKSKNRQPIEVGLSHA